MPLKWKRCLFREAKCTGNNTTNSNQKIKFKRWLQHPNIWHIFLTWTQMRVAYALFSRCSWTCFPAILRRWLRAATHASLCPGFTGSAASCPFTPTRPASMNCSREEYWQLARKSFHMELQANLYSVALYKAAASTNRSVINIPKTIPTWLPWLTNCFRFEIHIFELRNEELNVKKILAVINATYAVAKAWKNQACRDSNPDLCDTGAAL